MATFGLKALRGRAAPSPFICLYRPLKLKIQQDNSDHGHRDTGDALPLDRLTPEKDATPEDKNGHREQNRWYKRRRTGR